jgi:hypothetical protein
VIVEPKRLVEDALAAANDVPLRAVRGERRHGRVLFVKLIKSLRRLGVPPENPVRVDSTALTLRAGRQPRS